MPRNTSRYYIELMCVISTSRHPRIIPRGSLRNDAIAKQMVPQGHLFTANPHLDVSDKYLMCLGIMKLIASFAHLDSLGFLQYAGNVLVCYPN